MSERGDDRDTVPGGRIPPQQAAQRTGLLRSLFGRTTGEPHPEALEFAGRVAQAVGNGRAEPAPVAVGAAEAGAEAPTDPGVAETALLDRDAIFAEEADGPGRALRDAAFGTNPGIAVAPADAVPLPAAPALVCDLADRVVRVNAGLLRLLGAPTADHLVGRRLGRILSGPDVDARALRADGGTARVRVVRWQLPERQLRAVVLVELDDPAPPPAADARVLELRHAADRAIQRFADLMAGTPAGIAVVDPAGRIVEANPALSALLEVGPEQLRGMPVTTVCPEPGWLRPVPPGAHHGYRLDALPLRRGDGTTVWCDTVVSATSDGGEGWCWLVACTDVSERRRAAELLRTAGTVDELTRLPNRAAALALLDRMLAEPLWRWVAVVCGDLDDFQRVNDALGHEAGDDTLVTLAARLQRELPVGCTAARLAGDEFVVVCADHSEAGGPEALAHRVAQLLRTTVTVHGRPVEITASVGVATPDPAGPPPVGPVRAADLLRSAEVAMRQARRGQARDAVGVATDGAVSTAAQALETEAELRAAIAAGALTLEYQPVVGPDGEIVTAEALVRWPHLERGMIPPAEFLPVAERCGLLRELDVWVLRTACAEAARWSPWRAHGPAVAVNLAGLLPGDPAFLETVTAAVTDADLPWPRLVLELVETSLVALPPQALAVMAELAGRGVRFAVDDFGTGYSSLARLKELPAQIVKVDRAFVAGVGTDPADLAVVRAIVDLAAAMGRATVAEGVETAAQYAGLREVGVGAFQGWLFSRPLSVEEIREVLGG